MGFLDWEINDRNRDCSMAFVVFTQVQMYLAFLYAVKIKPSRLDVPQLINSTS
jgi:hypothetical protein